MGEGAPLFVHFQLNVMKQARKRDNIMKTSISRRQFLAAVGAAAAVSALSACGSSSSSSTAVSGAASGSASASGDTIKVGLLAPLTGDVSVYGIAVANGANLYIKQLNEAGGINGKQVEVVEMDEQGDATQAVTCFTQMVDQGITALIGDVTTTPTLAVVAETQAYNMPMVTASAPAEEEPEAEEEDIILEDEAETEE